MHSRHVVTAAALLGLVALRVDAQAPAAPSPVRYDRAEQLLNWNTTRMVTGDEVQAQWMKDGARFWYRNKVKQGA